MIGRVEENTIQAFRAYEVKLLSLLWTSSNRINFINSSFLVVQMDPFGGPIIVPDQVLTKSVPELLKWTLVPSTNNRLPVTYNSTEREKESDQSSLPSDLHPDSRNNFQFSCGSDSSDRVSDGLGKNKKQKQNI